MLKVITAVVRKIKPNSSLLCFYSAEKGMNDRSFNYKLTSPGWMHETSARTWCTGKTQREVGGGIGMGNTCKSMADSCQCMAKTTTIL